MLLFFECEKECGNYTALDCNFSSRISEIDYYHPIARVTITRFGFQREFFYFASLNRTRNSTLKLIRAHLLRDSRTSTLNRSSNRILSSSLKNSSTLSQPFSFYARTIVSQEGIYLPLSQFLLKLEHPLIIIMIVVKRCHAARHSKVKKTQKQSSGVSRGSRYTIDSNLRRERPSCAGFGNKIATQF